MGATLEKRTGPRGTTWHVVISKDRKKTRKSYGKDKAKAQKAVSVANQRIRAGTLGIADKPSGPTLAEHAAIYLKHVEALGASNDEDGLAARTVKDRQRLLGASSRLMRALGDVKLQAIDATAVEALWEESYAGLARQTKKNALNVLSDVLRHARKSKLIANDPVGEFRRDQRKPRGKKARAARAAAKRRRPIPSEVVSTILTAAKVRGQRAHAIVLTAMDSGMRPEELRGLEWRDVQFGESDMDTSRHFDLQRSIAAGVATVEPLKAGVARKVHMSRRLRSVLREWRETLVATGKWAGTRGEAGRVFRGFEQGNWSSRDWHVILEAAKLKRKGEASPYWFYWCRHSYATLLLNAGTDTFYVSGQLGHASVETTMSHYGSYLPESDAYRAPLALKDGEVPSDLIARLTDPNRTDWDRAAGALP